MEEDNKVSKETKVKLPNANPYSKVREEDDAETEAFAKGELSRFQREQKEKEAEAATEQKDTDASEETAEPTDQKATPIAERPAKAEVELLKLHPDFNDIRSKDDFHEWAEQQDPTIQGWLYENTSNSKLAARAIDLYKSDRGISKAKKEDKDLKKEAAKAISKTKKATDTDTPKKRIWTTSEISKLKPHQFEKFEKEIDLARLEGRIEQR